MRSVDAVLLGEHGTTTFLSEQLSTVNGLPVNATFDPDTLAELMILVKASAGEIKETQEATIYGVSYCAVRIFEALFTAPGQAMPVSTYIPAHLQAALGTDKVFLSLMSEVSNKGARPVESYQPDALETANFQKCLDLIGQCIPKRYL